MSTTKAVSREEKRMAAKVKSRTVAGSRNSKSLRQSRRVKRAVALAVTAVSVQAYERMMTSVAHAQVATYYLVNSGAGDGSGDTSFTNAGNGAGWDIGPLTSGNATQGTATNAVTGNNAYVLQATNATITSDTTTF